MKGKEHYYLLAIGVDPDQQGHGYGGRLLAHCLNEFFFPLLSPLFILFFSIF